MPLPFPPESVLRFAGLAHLVSLSAIVFAPAHLGWKSELARLPKLLRQMCNAYNYYTAGTIVALGLVSLLCANELTSGTPLARAVCGYTTIFWAVRLWLQYHYDFRPHLTSTALRVGYHGLTALFIFFVVLYGWLTFRG